MDIRLIRNFSIISHIDHGKSTLADRFLELTRTIDKTKLHPQYLDMMDLEREKGITIKMQPVRMIYRLPTTESQEKAIADNQLAGEDLEFILNLIDTPGHVDFSYEVSRALAAVEGAILLVDATQGIQAQTLAHLELAKKQGLTILPALNKIDLTSARIEEVSQEVADLLEIEKEEIIKISAKYGTNVEKILKKIIEKIPSPQGNIQSPFRALIFDSKYDPYKGIIAYVRVIDGQINEQAEIYLMAAKTKGVVKEIGYFKPEFFPQKKLVSGEIGYIATGIKEAGKVRVGDTIIKIQNSKFKIQNFEIEPLPGYKEPQPVVFVSFYPENADDFDLLKKSLEQLKLTDPSFTFAPESKEGLGRGFRCGFLGSLHAEIISERLRREFGLNLIISAPSLIYKAILQTGKELFIYSPQDFPAPSQIKETQELYAKLEIIIPQNFLGETFELLKKIEGRYVGFSETEKFPKNQKGGRGNWVFPRLGRQGANEVSDRQKPRVFGEHSWRARASDYVQSKYIGKEKIIIIFEAPLREIILGFYDKLKGVTKGYGSLNYEILGFKKSDLVKLEILIAGKKEEVFSKIVSSQKAYKEGRALVEKLKEILPPQQFALPLQAAVFGKIIARETIKARRKDVLAPLYGGDVTRKKKLLEKQKRGKKELKEKGKIKIPPSVYFKIFHSTS